MKNRTSTGVKGIVRVQLVDRDGNSKKLFQGNKIWSLLKKAFNLDVQLPFITGKWTLNGVMYNTIAATGLSESAKLLGGIAADPISHMAIGIGTPSATALGSEIATNGGQRAAVTPTSQTTTITGDTNRSVNTFTFTGSFAVTEEGLFNAGAAGDMIASRSFSAINVTSGDSLQITHDIVFSAA